MARMIVMVMMIVRMIMVVVRVIVARVAMMRVIVIMVVRMIMVVMIMMVRMRHGRGGTHALWCTHCGPFAQKAPPFHPQEPRAHGGDQQVARDLDPPDCAVHGAGGRAE